MRAAEWINIAVFGFLLVLGWVRPLERARRLAITGWGAAGIAASLFSAFAAPRLFPALAASVMRDWIPAALVLLVYWQAGRFFTRIDETAQRRLLALDARIVVPVLKRVSARRAGRIVLTWLELAYLFCYPMVPFALAAVYLLRAREQTDAFWATVLPATYFCYVMVPFMQTLPPRLAGEGLAAPVTSTGVRIFNLWILNNASIHANTFPSAHVAASLSCALVLLRLSPAVGIGFLVVAVSIALGAVAGRYHYAADAITGALVALAAAAVF